MPKVIAGIYEIDQQIGSGGGGVVYLGRHLRLQKLIVLKADKRKLTTDRAKLRREVDLLKGLTQTYIPQVYDFVEEDGVVYTVMDYIEGESLDKVLKRGQIPAQRDVVKWACELLEALSYLHSRKPYGILHGDIKPANVMLRPDGTICLIDYNIALALGEDGAISVGYSKGYASPESYGLVYMSARRAAAFIANGGTTNSSLPNEPILDTEAMTGGRTAPVHTQGPVSETTEVLPDSTAQQRPRVSIPKDSAGAEIDIEKTQMEKPGGATMQERRIIHLDVRSVLLCIILSPGKDRSCSLLEIRSFHSLKKTAVPKSLQLSTRQCPRRQRTDTRVRTRCWRHSAVCAAMIQGQGISKKFV